MATARDVARAVLGRVEQGAWATHALDGALDRSGLDVRDRRLAAELVYGVLRHRSRLDRALGAYADLGRAPPPVRTALRVGAYQLLMLRVPAHAAVDDAVGAARARGGGKLAGFVNAVLRRVAAHGEPALPTDPIERAVVEHSTPRWIVDVLLAAAGPGADPAEVIGAFAQPAPLWARANLARATRDEVAAALVAEGAEVEPSARAPAALRVTGLGDPAASRSFAAGLWTVQDLGAQLVTELAAPRAGQRLLDACAGVGGKSTLLAERSGGAATIDAADVSVQKLRLAAEAAARLGHTSIQTIVADLTDPAAPLAPAYDVVVLDAPCTGLGVLRRHPEAKWRLEPADVDRLAELQARLVDALAPRVAPGGALVYSVCTLTAAEGPAQVDRLAGAGFVVEETLRTWPHADGADGFFAARLRRG